MANQYTALELDLDEAIRLYESGLTQEEVGKKLGTTQKVIYERFKKIGYKSRIARKRNQWGDKNHMWKGDDATYAAKHHWIEKQKGKPNKCEDCGTTQGQMDWASIDHLYLRDVNNWKRLCRKCHRKMDKNLNT